MHLWQLLLLAVCCCTTARMILLSPRERARKTMSLTGTTLPMPAPELAGPIDVCPEAVNLIAWHVISHHRELIVTCINNLVGSPYTLSVLNEAAGNRVFVQRIAFNVTGPLAPERFFNCVGLRLSRAPMQRSDLLYADVALEYRSRGKRVAL
mgnify:CR=1 FL=1|jgi:hypothetical protein